PCRGDRPACPWEACRSCDRADTRARYFRCRPGSKEPTTKRRDLTARATATSWTAPRVIKLTPSCHNIVIRRTRRKKRKYGARRSSGATAGLDRAPLRAARRPLSRAPRRGSRPEWHLRQQARDALLSSTKILGEK